jgi:AcrR family transcriptional regulator
MNKPHPRSTGSLDRRIQRTRRLLRQALLDAIQEKDYEQITVEEICRRADIGRGTFYLHYKDKEELLLDVFTELVEDRMAQFASFPLSILSRTQPIEDDGQPPVAQRPIAGVFAHAAEHAAVYRLALKGEGAARMTEHLRQMIAQSLDDLLQAKLREAGLTHANPIPLDLAAQTLVSAFLAGLAWWLEHDMPYPPEDMARMFREMYFPAMRVALGFS